MSLDPMGPGQPPGFSTGYLIGCAVVLTVLVVELAVFALLQ